MLAKSLPELPVADDMYYEPKWDGFRCIVFRDGDEVELASRGGKTLTRYFPEVVDFARAQLPKRCVLDGELVTVLRDKGKPTLDFDTLSQRIHPAASRVTLLARTTPASFVAFDVLALKDSDLTSEPFRQRRETLNQLLSDAVPPVYLTPATQDLKLAHSWFELFEGAGLDGIVAKPGAGQYQPGKRAMYKIKHARTADCVVAGFRWHKSGPVVGSLLLGLYDDAGTLHHVGVTSSFTAARRAELVTELEPYRAHATERHPWLAGEQRTDGTTEHPEGQRIPGGPSRWTGKRDLTWEPLRPELVCEVAYDHLEGDRFRHTTQFQRWRPDRTPDSCRYVQLERPVRFDVDDVLSDTGQVS